MTYSTFDFRRWFWNFDDMTKRVEERMGKIPLSRRYHKSPHRIDSDYQISGKVLGSGYNGDVCLALRKGHGKKRFAVKALALSSLEGAKLEQLKEEVHNLLSMDHPHVIRLYDVYESSKYLHLVMECMEGGELFDRLSELKRFPEADASETIFQMLLAVNYIHSHGIVHRDLKLENFLYDKPKSNHLKLIDFGFSKTWDPKVKMDSRVGTASYVAPEVLQHSYTNKCDLWSLGVISFTLLAGYMPFSGSDAQCARNIIASRYTIKPDKWSGVSHDAIQFVRSLLEPKPHVRLSAQQALDHPWIISNTKNATKNVDIGIARALHDYSQASKFRRCCMAMMAWALAPEDLAKVREYFITMDMNKQGTIILNELAKVLSSLGISDEEIHRVFNILDSNNDQEIHYSDFLAAMVDSKIALNDDYLTQTFQTFDADSSGYITVPNLRVVLGDTFEGETVAELFSEADRRESDKLYYDEFVAHLSKPRPSFESVLQTHPGCRLKRAFIKVRSALGRSNRHWTP